MWCGVVNHHAVVLNWATMQKAHAGKWWQPGWSMRESELALTLFWYKTLAIALGSDFGRLITPSTSPAGAENILLDRETAFS